jgi:hypothetical protein
VSLADQLASDTPADQRFRMGNPFDRMVADFREYAAVHPMIKPLNLTFEEQRPGAVLVYQGQKSVVWAWLRTTGCTFVRRSLLRSILNLKSTDEDHPLYRYFRQYSLITGEYDATL